MITMLICIVLLILGYVLYGRFVEKVFGPHKNRKTPAYSKQDGVDFVPLPAWKVFMIQFLNIAGTGPIFGAIMGAKFGPSCYIWIVVGCIFGGAVHDYFSGMMSVEHAGEGLPTLVGRYLGTKTKDIMLAFTVVLLLLVGAVFVYSPAVILGGIIKPGSTGAAMICVGVILVYYIFATLVPIDKIIGKIYPFFAIALIFMAVSLFICLIVKWPVGVPEIWEGLQNRDPASGSLFPCLCISIACGAVSGFHATQSPLMARCIEHERLGRPIFYGAMITEGIIAVIWATIGSYFFFAGGNVEMGAEGVTAAPQIVTIVANSWLGKFGGLLALLGVVAAPITSGDTSLRSARLIIADAIHMKQHTVRERLRICIPMFIVTGVMLWFNIADENGFNIIWRYFGWANQTLAIFTFWTITVYLTQHKKGLYYLITLFPACFMTSVCTTFICISKIGFNIPTVCTPYIGIGTFVISLVLFFVLKDRKKKAKLA